MCSLKKALLKHQLQNRLNSDLRRLVENEGVEAIEAITALLKNGAEPNHREKFQESLICTVLYEWPFDTQAVGIELLTRFGANVNLPGEQRQTPLSFCLVANYPSEIGDLLLSKGAVPIESTAEDFKNSAVHCRYGVANPESIGNGYYNFMIATGQYAAVVGKSPSTDLFASSEIYKFEADFDDLTSKARSGELSGEAAAGFFNFLTHGQPKWCNHRFGSTDHVLADGTLLQIGGEHEDFSDPDFNIYNDVITISPRGAVQVYLYPEQVFPPTDFHTSTKVGNDIIIIGGLGYRKDIIEGQTNIYALNLEDFSIRHIPSSGNNPGWIHEHTTHLDEENDCLYILGGQQWTNGKSAANDQIFRLDLTTKVWSRAS